MYLFLRRYAPFATFGGGFEGDTRTEATTLATATARTVAVVQFDAISAQAYSSFSDGTRFLGAGPWLAEMIGKKTAKVRAVVSNIVRASTGLSFTMFSAGSNPLVPLSPDIDTYVDFTATFHSGGMRFEGTVRGDSFPNAEVFVVDENKREVLLFDFRTRGGRNLGPGRLIGEHDSVVLGRFGLSVPSVGPPVGVVPVWR